MVFVRKSPGRAGSTKVQIAQRRAGRDVVLEHVGTAHDDAELAALMAVAHAKLHEGQAELALPGIPEVSRTSPAVGRSRAGAAMITGKSSAVLWQVLQAAYAHLGFDTIGDEAFKQLVLARIVEPTSKADSLRVLDDLGVGHASLRTMFRSLRRAQEADYRSKVAAGCFAHALVAGDVSLCLYDVTTLYFDLTRATGVCQSNARSTDTPRWHESGSSSGCRSCSDRPRRRTHLKARGPGEVSGPRRRVHHLRHPT